MNLAKAKKAMLAFRDFYGQDITQTDKIKNAKNMNELRDVLMEHRRWLEDQAIDARTDLDRFDKKIFPLNSRLRV